MADPCQSCGWNTRVLLEAERAHRRLSIHLKPLLPTDL